MPRSPPDLNSDHPESWLPSTVWYGQGRVGEERLPYNDLIKVVITLSSPAVTKASVMFCDKPWGKKIKLFLESNRSLGVN